MLKQDYERNARIETEKKYVVPDNEIFVEVERFLSSDSRYGLAQGNQVIQTDKYYDTSDGLLNKMDKTLRIREVSGRKFLFIKAPIESTKTEPSLNERREFENEIVSADIFAHKEFILKHVPELKSRFDELVLTLTITNRRRKYDVWERDIRYELVFDEVTYSTPTNQSAKDWQLEIELKSEHLHRVNLKILGDLLEKKFPELHSTDESKYKRGLRLTSDGGIDINNPM